MTTCQTDFRWVAGLMGSYPTAIACLKRRSKFVGPRGTMGLLQHCAALYKAQRDVRLILLYLAFHMAPFASMRL